MSIISMMKKDFKKQSEVKTSKAEFLQRMGFEPKKRLPKYRNPGRRVAIAIPCAVLGVVVLVPSIAFLIYSIHFTSEEKRLSSAYSLMSARKADEETFKSLNGITYQEQEYRLSAVSQEYRNNVNNFAYSLTKGVDMKKESALFSPLSVFLVNDLASYAGDDEAKEIYTSALGDPKVNGRDYESMLRTNFFVNNQGSTQIYNGAFFRKGIEYKQPYVDFLTSRNVEAFQVDYGKGKSKVVDWANARLGGNLLDESSLETSEQAALFFLSLLYFKSKWLTPFVKEKTTDGDFYLLNGESVSKPFMRHKISSYPTGQGSSITPYRGVYRYDGYISCYDHYANDYSIQYLVPERLEDNIFDLLEGVNFLIEDESCYYSNVLLQERHISNISLSVPRFELKATADLTDALRQTPLAPLVIDGDPTGAIHHALGNAIDDENEKIHGSYIELAKQYSAIEFNEDGTTIRSAYFQAMAGATSAAPSGDYNVNLDQPFVYVIRDGNGLPLFIGSYIG